MRSRTRRFAQSLKPASSRAINKSCVSTASNLQDHQQHKLIKSLQEQKVPVHTIGSQAHLNVSINFETMDQTLAEIASLGLPIHITELDVNSAAGGQGNTGADVVNNTGATEGGLVNDADKKLADAYAGIFRAFVKHRQSVKMVTFWGANDGNSWRARSKPLLFDGDNQPKPAFEAVIRAAAK